MTRLYNHTRYSDGILRDVLNFAARTAGVKGDVPVKLTYCEHLHGGGDASNSWPYRKTLIGKPTTSKDKRTLKAPIGWIEIRLPRDLKRRHPNTSDPPIDAAEWFLDVAIHEMAHVAQFRRRHESSHSSNPFWGYRTGSQRRIAHNQRPCEIDAQNVVDETHQRRDREQRRQDLVIMLAIELETRQ